MEPDEFIKAINDSPIQHYAVHAMFPEATLATFRAIDKENIIQVSGCWISLITNGPMHYETLDIKKENLQDWTIGPKYPKYEDG